MAHFVLTTKKTSAKEVARLFQNNIWKLYSLPKSIITNRRVQFAVGMMRELNHMLGIDTKLSMTYYL